MAQGWTINRGAGKINFFEPPPTGTGNIVVTQYAAGAVGGTKARRRDRGCGDRRDR